MKNLIYLAIAIFGIGIGYFYRESTIDYGLIPYDKFTNLIESQYGRQSLIKYFSDGPAPPESLKVDNAKTFIKNLYTNRSDFDTTIEKTISPSYVFDLRPILLKALAINKVDPINLKDLQMRLFPAKNNDSLTFVIGIEDQTRQLYLEDYALYDFISPCPKKCPTKNDIFNKQEWETMYNTIFPNRKFEYPEY